MSPPDAGTAALRFTVEDARPEPFAAVPTLAFTLGVEQPDGTPIRAVALDVQVRIAAARRAYDDASRARLAELFGEPADWGRSLRSLLWTTVAVQVPPFTGRARVALPIACTYDLEVAAAKYFQALAARAVPEARRTAAPSIAVFNITDRMMNLHKPGFGIRDSGSGIRDPGFGIRGSDPWLGSGVRNRIRLL